MQLLRGGGGGAEDGQRRHIHAIVRFEDLIAFNVDLTHVLKHLPLSQFDVQRRADGFVILGLAADGARIIIEELNVDDKALQYSSDLPRAAA